MTPAVPSGRRWAFRVPLLVAVLLLAGAGQATGDDPDVEARTEAAPESVSAERATERATLRVDYFHTGGQGDEIFAVDRVVVEPLPWPGHPAGDVDPSGHGPYRFEVRDLAGGLLYSRGFGSIYGEWVTTAEARQRHRTFHESLRFPFPESPVEVVLFARDGENRLREVWRLVVDPEDMYVDPAPPPDQRVIDVEVHGPPAEKVDLLLLGDGYTERECEEKFPHDARRMAEALFAVEPFASRRTDFNVRGLCPPSPESGVSRPSTGRHVRSPLGATYDVFGSERYVLTYDNRVWRDVAAWAPYEFVTLLVNAETYGGGGLHNLYSTVAVDSDWADYLFVHEFGHHFAALADEYYTSSVAYEPPSRVVEPWEPNVTALLDPEALKWGDLVAPTTPLPTPWPKRAFEEAARDYGERRREIRARELPESHMSELFREEQAAETALLSAAEHAGHVGAFQGANYDARSYYRPQVDCVMFTRNRVPFCAVCSRAIEAVIDLHARGGVPGAAGR